MELVIDTRTPLIAGILDLFAGVPALVLGITLVLGQEMPGLFVAGFGLERLAIPLIIAGTITVAGGFTALRRRAWGLALAGSVSAFFCAWFLGIPAFVFTLMGRKHFR